MEVTVHLHTILERPTPDGMVRRLLVTLPAGSDLADLLQVLALSLPAEALLLAVNGRTAPLHRQLVAGDVINVMPAIAGG